MKLLVCVRLDEPTGQFVAQGKELDLCAQGDTPEDALRAFADLMEAQRESDAKRGREPFFDTPDYRDFDRWASADSEGA